MFWWQKFRSIKVTRRNLEIQVKAKPNLSRRKKQSGGSDADAVPPQGTCLLGNNCLQNKEKGNKWSKNK